MLLAAVVLACASSAVAQVIGPSLPVEDEATLIDQKLGGQIALDASFRDETGKQVRLADYFTGEKPVILNLQYYRCPSLCGPVLNGLVEALDTTPLNPGSDFTVLSVSFDHREEPDVAKPKKDAVLSVYNREGAAENWHFLTGSREDILALTGSVGFGFRWNETREDFDHRAALIFISPNGEITRYLRGRVFDPSTFRLAIVEASEGTVGSALDRFLLSCYSYDPRTGTYSRIGPVVMTAGGALTLLGLATLLFVLWRREWRSPAPAAAS